MCIRDRLKMTEWNGTKPLVDLMCGSGTFLIEAINQLHKVPLKSQQFYLFENWLDFKKDIYLDEKNKAQKKVITLEQLSKIIGCEINKDVFDQAILNIKLAGLENYIELQNDDFKNIQFKSSEGLVLCLSLIHI